MSDTAYPIVERRTPVGTAAGVIDTIADAATLVSQRPWLMIVPLLVDILLWLSYKISMMPLMDRMIRLIETSRVEGSDALVEQMRTSGDQVMISDYLGAFVPSLFSGISIDSILGLLMMFFMPDGFGVPRSQMYAPWRNGLAGTIEPGSALAVAGYWFGAVILSSIALVLFRVPIVRAVRGTHPTNVVKELATGWMHFIAYLGILIMGGAIAFIPLAVVATLVPIFGLSLVFVLSFGLLIFGGMLGVYTLFTVDAMLVHRTSPINGFRMSWRVGRAYFGQTAQFALTCIFLMLATLKLWSELVDSAPGFIISLIGSAFVGTVLAAASVLFYTDRFRLVRANEAGRRNVPINS